MLYAPFFLPPSPDPAFLTFYPVFPLNQRIEQNDRKRKVTEDGKCRVFVPIDRSIRSSVSPEAEKIIRKYQGLQEQNFINELRDQIWKMT
jgi:hypothetical protein